MSATIDVREGQPAVNVKDDSAYWHGPLHDDLEALDQAEVDRIYEGLQMTFWEFSAPELARAYGYERVFSTGQSEGWLIVEPTPSFLDHEVVDLDDLAEVVEARDTFMRFANDIKDEITYLRGEFERQIREAARRARREPSEAAEWAARDVITIEEIEK